MMPFHHCLSFSFSSVYCKLHLCFLIESTEYILQHTKSFWSQQSQRIGCCARKSSILFAYFFYFFYFLFSLEQAWVWGTSIRFFFVQVFNYWVHKVSKVSSISCVSLYQRERERERGCFSAPSSLLPVKLTME